MANPWLLAFHSFGHVAHLISFWASFIYGCRAANAAIYAGSFELPDSNYGRGKDQSEEEEKEFSKEKASIQKQNGATALGFAIDAAIYQAIAVAFQQLQPWLPAMPRGEIQLVDSQTQTTETSSSQHEGPLPQPNEPKSTREPFTDLGKVSSLV
jgi:hypothetical protein